METQNRRRYKETETRRKLERGIGIEEETKNERTIWKILSQEKKIKSCD